MSDISLEIHHLDVRGGDATAIIVKDHVSDAEGKVVYRVLIDAGAEGSGSSALKHYLEKYFAGTHFDLIVATHYHQDHIQGFFEAGIQFDQFLDIGGYAEAKNFEATPANGIGTGARTGTFSAYAAQVQAQLKRMKEKDPKTISLRCQIPFFNVADRRPFEIELGGKSDITLKCYCADGILADGSNVLTSQKATKARKFNPNDLSLALLVEWGQFRYFTAGDLSGDTEMSSYYDVEKPLIDYLKSDKGPLAGGKTVSVFKASHHGSEHSNQLYLLGQLKPETIVVSCNQMKEVPSEKFLERLSSLDTKPIVAFSNSLHVFKGDERYDALSKIKEQITDGNVIFSDQDGNTQASNLGTKVAVIRRRVKNGLVVDQSKPERDCAGYQLIKDSHDIVLIKRSPDEVNNLQKKIVFQSYDINRSFAFGTLDEVKGLNKAICDGFKIQAEEISAWAKKDKSDSSTVGIDFITAYFPGFIETWSKFQSGACTKEQAVDQFYKKMDVLLTAAVKIKMEGEKPYFNLHTPANILNDDKITLYYLLVDNINQTYFNLRYSPNGGRKLLESPYPEDTGGRMKRGREYAPKLPSAKRGK
ncbi:hypothetical protein [Undibacterium sp. TS12]|uniref:ComEC/Rec2 family competence protein n=1 Tax=Undibacterium sp. TS12 TaxID=2908202 RepID=UPI001F4D028E|nr:hypothetical protein [Undibacterium sp. TS12]MCH8619359.1 hypothetical protein [Undibacterium sp. TS12]